MNNIYNEIKYVVNDKLRNNQLLESLDEIIKKYCLKRRKKDENIK